MNVVQRRLVLHGVVLAYVLELALVGRAQASSWTSEDTLAAIEQASTESGVSASWLRGIVWCETGGTFRPDLIGAAGEQGAAQLKPNGGQLDVFYRYGYADPFDPYQAVDFLAVRLKEGAARYWTCAH